MYGRKGFTTKKTVNSLIEPYKRTTRKGVAPIDGLDLATAAQLLAALPPEQADDRVSDAAPTFKEFIEFGDGIQGYKLIGLHVGPERDDERISVNGFTIPQPCVDIDVMGKVVSRAADAKMMWSREGSTAVLVVRW